MKTADRLDNRKIIFEYDIDCQLQAVLFKQEHALQFLYLYDALGFIVVLFVPDSSYTKKLFFFLFALLSFLGNVLQGEK